MGFDGSEVVCDEDVGACLGAGFVEAAVHEEGFGRCAHAVDLDIDSILFWDVELFQHDLIAPVAC